MVFNNINWFLGDINLNPEGHVIPKDLRSEIVQLKAIPPLPGTALRIIDFISDPKADACRLATIIETDPIVTAQLIRWASSPLYGYRGNIRSVHDAITRVLGFNFVLDLALGLAVLSPLKAPRDGVVGTRVFWIQALSSTRLMARLAEKMPIFDDLNHTELFLVALLHNIGFPLFGHQFPKEFIFLNQLIAANPALPVLDLETNAFGIHHGEIGAWLLKAWSMPQVIAEVVSLHHNPVYRGDNYRLNLLTYLNDYLLGQIGIGDAINASCPDEVWIELGLEEEACQSILSDLTDDIEKFKTTAEEITG